MGMSQENRGNIFEKVFANVELLRYLFELLNREEQLKFATVSHHFNDFYREFICCDPYRRLIIEKRQEFVMITNEDTHEELYVSYEGLEYFLNIYAEDIQQLTEIYGSAIRTQNLKNLISISYKHMIITNHHLQHLAQNCPLLEKLHIFGCCNKNHEIIKLGEDLSIHSIMRMKQLKQFSLKNVSDFGNRTTALQDMLIKLKLQYRHFKEIFIPDPEDVALEMEEVTNHLLQDLDIYGSFFSSFWSWNLKTFLSKFENLSSLTITLSDVANDEVIETIAHSCQYLKKLSFNHTTFSNIEKFSILMRLKELSFHWCKGLSYDNLKEILSEMTLEKFSSTYTKYYGLFQYYFVSPTLKSIHIDAFHSFEFRCE